MFEPIAENLDMEPFELSGFSVDEAGKSFSRQGLDCYALKQDIAR